MDPVVFVILAVLLSVTALYLVAQPLIAKAQTARPTAISAQEELEELLAQRDAAFQALRELNFDRRVGKITEEDFVVFEANLKQTAADSLRALDQWEARADDNLDSAIEKAVSARRAMHGGQQACPTCGRAVAPADKFCAHCGQPMPTAPVQPAPRAAAVCSKCGQPCEGGDRFCASCGEPLSVPATA